MKTINQKCISILALAAAGIVSADAIASKSKVTVAQARGGLRSLRNAGLVGGDNEAVTMKAAGTKFLAKNVEAPPAVAGPAATSRVRNRRTKMAKATTLFQRHFDQGRQKVLSKFETQLEMTPGEASTYYQLCRKEAGMTAAA
jgi:hypothetical protein